MTLVKDVIGPSVTGHLRLACGDLGIMRWDAVRGCIAAMFGDNFSQIGLKGDWRSPSVVLYDNGYKPIGTPGGGPVTSLWPYQHDNGEYTTILPTDFIYLNGLWHASVMITKGLGNELSTQFHSSPDLVTWNPEPELVLQHPSHPGNVMLTFDQIGDWIYIYGTGGLGRKLPIWLWRCQAHTFPRGWWEPWGYNVHNGWAWGNPNESTPVLTGRFGELCFRALDGACVLSFFDAVNYCCTALSFPMPTSNLLNANKTVIASGLPGTVGTVIPQLYGPFISPLSLLDAHQGMDFFVSQWNPSTYKVSLVTATLAAP